jgi:antirestriction protein ArdC
MRPTYERITNDVIERLKQGVVPWRRPWKTARNLVSGKPYRGVNALLLSTLGCASPWWVTFRQAQQLGGTVRKGEHGVRVIFWKPRTEEDEEERRPPILRTYTVFNLEQCDSIETPPTPERVETLENVAANMPAPPHITNGTAASYNTATDTVTLPALASFETADGYYATLFHELTHATGHEQRLNRPGVTGKHAYKSSEYAQEELVAEIGAAFLCGETGIKPRTIENSAAYIASWLKVLEEQPSILVQAAAAAQKAADHILNRDENPQNIEDNASRATGKSVECSDEQAPQRSQTQRLTP